MDITRWSIRSNQIRSVAQSCLTLCNPMNCSTPGLPVQHQLLEFTETHIHRVSDAIQPSHPLSSPSPPAPWNHINILCSQRWRSSIKSAKTRPGADCGSDHELLIAKFRLKLKKVWKTTRPFRYDLNQIPYDYTAKVTNRFKGLYMIDRVLEKLWTEEAGIKTIPKKKKCKKAKWLSEEAL